MRNCSLENLAPVLTNDQLPKLPKLTLEQLGTNQSPGYVDQTHRGIGRVSKKRPAHHGTRLARFSLSASAKQPISSIAKVIAISVSISLNSLINLSNQAAYRKPRQPKPPLDLTHSQIIKDCLPNQVVCEEQYGKKSHREYNDHRSLVKLRFGGPRHLAHLCLDTDQKISEFGPIHKPIPKPCSADAKSKGNP